MHERLIANLPDMNHNDQEGSDSSEVDVVPLDFRTAILEKNGKLVIQAKPLNLKSASDQLKEATKLRKDDYTIDPDSALNLDEYLHSVRKEAFSFEDEDVVLIDPGIHFKTIFKGIDLPCNKEKRINNSLNAPTRE